MASTPVQIANAAIGLLSGVPISALPPREWTLPAVTDPGFAEEAIRFTEAAQMCGATYYIVRDALFVHPWAFATRRSPLAPRPSEDDHVYEHFFWLPAEERALGIGIRAVYLSATRGRPLDDGWARERGGISTLYSKVWGEWIEDVREEEWPPLLTKALTLRLASDWAYYFSDQANLTESYDRMARQALEHAKAVDGQAKPSETARNFGLIDARYRRGGSRLARAGRT